MNLKTMILIVEDDPGLCLAMQRLLEKYGYATDGVELASSARSILKGIVPDVVILDLMLPDASGLTVLKQIREMRLSCRVVIVTAAMHRGMDGKLQGNPETIATINSLGVDHILCKPFYWPDLLVALGPAERVGK